MRNPNDEVYIKSKIKVGRQIFLKWEGIKRQREKEGKGDEKTKVTVHGPTPHKECKHMY